MIGEFGRREANSCGGKTEKGGKEGGGRTFVIYKMLKLFVGFFLTSFTQLV